MAGRTGVGRYVENLIRHLPPLIDAYAPRIKVWGNPAILEPQGIGHFFGIIPAPAARPISTGAIFGRIPQEIRGAALVHFPFINIPAGFRGRHTVTIHDAIPFSHPAKPGRAYAAAQWALHARAIHGAARIFTVSHAAAKAISQLFPGAAGRLRVVYNGVDPALYHPAPAAGAGNPFVLTVTSEKPHKNLRMLLTAHDMALARFPAAPELRVAGVDSRSPLARQFAHPKRRFLGLLREAQMPDAYRTACALAAPSLEEGFSLPVIESLACGTPVLASDIPVFRELLPGAGLLDPDKPMPWARALAESSQLPRLNAAATATIHQHFSWSAMARAHWMVFQETLAGGPQ